MPDILSRTQKQYKRYCLATKLEVTTSDSITKVTQSSLNRELQQKKKKTVVVSSASQARISELYREERYIQVSSSRMGNFLIWKLAEQIYNFNVRGYKTCPLSGLPHSLIVCLLHLMLCRCEWKAFGELNFSELPTSTSTHYTRDFSKVSGLSAASSQNDNVNLQWNWETEKKIQI